MKFVIATPRALRIGASTLGLAFAYVIWDALRASAPDDVHIDWWRYAIPVTVAIAALVLVWYPAVVPSWLRSLILGPAHR